MGLRSRKKIVIIKIKILIDKTNNESDDKLYIVRNKI
jgi:hypothetical protein